MFCRNSYLLRGLQQKSFALVQTIVRTNGLHYIWLKLVFQDQAGNNEPNNEQVSGSILLQIRGRAETLMSKLWVPILEDQL
jgi:hypothetical protein